MTLQWKTNIKSDSSIDQNTTYDITPISSPNKHIAGDITNHSKYVNAKNCY